MSVILKDSKSYYLTLLINSPPIFKMITGQCDQLERKLIEEIFLGDLKKTDELAERLKLRSSQS